MIHCPKCRGSKLKIFEHIVVPEAIYQNVNGVVTYFVGETGDCYVIKYEAICLNCKREWKLKKRPALPTVNIPVHTNKGDIQKWLNGEPVWFDEGEDESLA